MKIQKNYYEYDESNLHILAAEHNKPIIEISTIFIKLSLLSFHKSMENYFHEG